MAIPPILHQHTEPATDPDITHHQHATIEPVFADLINGPLAHLPSGVFAANATWTVLAAITHNLPRLTRSTPDPTTPSQQKIN